jgi:hypothetical protein
VRNNNNGASDAAQGSGALVNGLRGVHNAPSAQPSSRPVPHLQTNPRPQQQHSQPPPQECGQPLSQQYSQPPQQQYDRPAVPRPTAPAVSSRHLSRAQRNALPDAAIPPVSAQSRPDHFKNEYGRLAPDIRPGGKAPWNAMKPSRYLEECYRYPESTHEPGKRENLVARPILLNLAVDETLQTCFGVYFLNEYNRHTKLCPYIMEPDLCRNNHRLTQDQIDWVVTNRGVKHSTIQEIVDSIELAGAGPYVPVIRVPTQPSATAMTPAQLRLQHQSAFPRMPALGAHVATDIVVAQGGQGGGGPIEAV